MTDRTPPAQRTGAPVATSPVMLRARHQPPARRVASLTARMLRQRIGLAYGVWIRRDPLSELFVGNRRDPYPLYERLRALGPMPRTPLGPRFSTDHAVCSELLTSRALGVRPIDPYADAFDLDIDLSLLKLNPPDHTRLRRLATPAFGRRRMEGYRCLIEETIDGLLDAAPTGEPWDLVERYSSPLPIAIIASMLGIPGYDEQALRRFGAAFAGALDGVQSTRHAYHLVRESRALEGVFTRLFELRATEPADDVVSSLVAAHDEGGIAAEDMVPLCTLLLVGGFETTVNLIGSAVIALQRHPEQWQMLVDDPSLAAHAVEETLRCTPPVHLTARCALEHTEIAGHRLRRNEAVIILLAAANRDPAVFERPAEFDITRGRATDHLGFSAGPHYCLGAPLARLEATMALDALVRRRPGLRLVGEVVPRAGVTIRGPERVPVLG